MAHTTHVPEASAADGSPPVRPARSLGAEGRCCGRKPLTYKTGRVTTSGIPQRFCTRCSRAYSLETGEQIANWAWLTTPGGFLPRYPDQAEAPQ